MNRRDLMALACLIRESYNLLPNGDEVTEDVVVKHLVDAANKSVKELYDYLNNRIAGGSSRFEYTGNCGACDPAVTHATIHNCGR